MYGLPYPIHMARNYTRSHAWWLIPVIPATWEWKIPGRKS
jgi:hypothetical protein